MQVHFERQANDILNYYWALLITMDLQATGNRVTDIVQRGTPWQHLKHKTVAIQLNSEEA